MIQVSINAEGMSLLNKIRMISPNFRRMVAERTTVAGEIMLEEIERSFQESGPGWPGLSQGHSDYKAKLGYNPEILDMTGTLRSSFYSQRTSAYSIAVRIRDGVMPEKRTASIRSNKKTSGVGSRPTIGYVGKIHEEGLGKQPARPFLKTAADRARPRTRSLFNGMFSGVSANVSPHYI